MAKQKSDSWLFPLNPNNDHWNNGTFKDLMNGKIRTYPGWNCCKDCKVGDMAYIIKTTKKPVKPCIVAFGNIVKITTTPKSSPKADIKFEKIIPMSGIPTSFLEGKHNFGQTLTPQKCSNILPNNVNIIETECQTAKGIDFDYHPLNLILYGPPGTGKTYNTIYEAVSIIENKTINDIKAETFDDIFKRFNDYKEKGQIVFTTFHQSLSYEEFIEGIKPSPDDSVITATHKNSMASKNQQFGEGTTVINDLVRMKYEVTDGIFKLIADDANQNRLNSSNNNSFQNLVDDFCSQTDASGNIKAINLLDSHGKPWHKITPHQKNYHVDSLRVNINNSTEQSLSVNTAKYYWEKFCSKKIKKVDDIKSPKTNKRLGTAWLYFGLFRALNEYRKQQSPQINNESKKKYVLIIDEINRGNVSQIFGELITLIEEDKRLGNNEELTVKLPYSSAIDPDAEEFGVPNNLYIIGSMNTADRSVEALDTALRRRFSFKEMMPDSHIKDTNGNDLFYNRVICGIKLGELMDTINNRIRILKDREHQIGHSYFMKCDKETDLINVFKDKIIPLLQEYFYGNYAYIGLILGDGFVQEDTDLKNIKFCKNFSNDISDETKYRLLTETEWEELKKAPTKFQTALENLMNK